MRFIKSKGSRNHKQFIWYQVEDLWYVPSVDKWLTYEEANKLNVDFCSARGCRSLRAFRKQLKKHPNIKGKAQLVNRFPDYDIYA